jgi:hypothetical protein
MNMTVSFFGGSAPPLEAIARTERQKKSALGARGTADIGKGSSQIKRILPSQPLILLKNGFKYL